MSSNTTNNRISTLIQSQVPFFVRNDHPNFMLLLEKYYEFLEQNNEVVARIKNVKNYFDVDRTADELYTKFYHHFLHYIPRDCLADKALVIKNIKDFYRARGTEKSIEFLINILYKKPASFYYPKVDILKTSDGRWYIEKSIKVTDVKVDGVSNNDPAILKNFISRTIVGKTSNASAIVESVDRFFEKFSIVTELLVTISIELSSIKKDFLADEEIETFYVEEGITHTLTARTFGGYIKELEIIDGGSNYVVGTTFSADPVDEYGGGGVIAIAAVSKGNLTSIYPIETGAGFRANDVVLISGGGGRGALAVVKAVETSGKVTPNTYSISNSTIYPIKDDLVTTLSTTTIADASTYFVYDNCGPISSIEIIDSGEDYKFIPSFEVVSNTTMRNLNILGKMRVTEGGIGYAVGDLIQFTNVFKGYGIGANAIVSNVASNGMIVEVKFTPKSGQVLGGTGYNKLPIATVLTTPSATSNLTISTGEGASVGNVNLSMWSANSNVSIRVGNRLNVNNEIVTVTTVNANSSLLTVSPGLSGNLESNTVVILGGVGANVQVLCVVGDGEELTANTATIGKITRMQILLPGLGYRQNPIVDMTNAGDGKANVKLQAITGIYEYPGRFLNDNSLISAYNFLQDGTYYHNYSYVVRTNIELNKYKNALLKLIHPSGMKLFSDYMYNDDGNTLDVSVTNLPTANSTFLPDDYIIISSTRNEISYTATFINVSTSVIKTKSYNVYVNNVQIGSTDHGMSVGNTVSLDSANVIGIAEVAGVINLNSYFVKYNTYNVLIGTTGTVNVAKYV